MRAIAVFCGSQNGKNPAYRQDAEKLGKQLARAGIRLIYGGGHKGLMRTLADAVLAGGGEVTGVIPEVLVEWEQQHTGISELIVVSDMHTRKRMMYDLADAAVIMPGGFGTLDEFFEMLTWNQLKIHDKPIFILNTNGFYDRMVEHLNTMEQEGFLYGSPWEKIKVSGSPDELVRWISAHE